MTTAAASYHDAAFPEPWQVLGLRLRPFSLGHYLKLRRLGCAFVADDTQRATIGDLLLGVIVCSMPTNPDPTQDPFWNWVGRDKPSGIAGWLYPVYRWWQKRKGREALTPAEIDVLRWGRKVGMFDFRD